MTAEIVVINKEAIALAADSAVTASIYGGQKIFTTADKIFKLVKNKPVGIMLYNSSQFLGIPWETIIFEIGSQIPETGFPTLKEYADFFLSFFKTGNTLFSESKQKEFFREYILTYLLNLVDKIVESVGEEIDRHGPISDKSIQLLITKYIKNESSFWTDMEKEIDLTSITAESSKKLVRRYRNIINEAIEVTFKQIPLSIKSKRMISEILQQVIMKGISNDYFTGIVITGFGDKEIFPSVKSFLIDGMFQDKLKYQKDTDCKVGIDTDGSIIAYAQREMVSRFMEGVDPLYREIESSFLDGIADKFANEVIGKLKKYSKSEKKALEATITTNCHAIIEDYKKTMDETIEKKFCDPITGIVAILPKYDLIKLAESLVSLTSLKRKFSTESETVAEPIDVAIISKKDGFVWIKQKQLSL
jgi:hypothetical protein